MINTTGQKSSVCINSAWVNTDCEQTKAGNSFVSVTNNDIHFPLTKIIMGGRPMQGHNYKLLKSGTVLLKHLRKT